MSLNVMNPLETRVLTPYNIDMSSKNLENEISVLIGPSNVNYDIQTAAGNRTSETELNFNIYSPSRNSTVLNKNVLLRGIFEVTIVVPGTADFATVVNKLLENNVALAANPFYSAVSNIVVNFDGNAITESISEYSKFIRYVNFVEDSLKYWDSYTPNYLDNSFFFTSAQKNSVLATGDDKSLSGILPRGGYNYYDFAINATDRTVSFKLNFSEPLNLSPFAQTSNAYCGDTGFIGFSNLKIGINFKSPQEMFNSCVSINPFADNKPEITMDVDYTGNTVTYVYPTLTPNLGANLGAFFSGTCKITNIDLVCKFDMLPLTVLSPDMMNYSYNKLQYISQEITQTINSATNLNPSTNQITLNSYNISAVPNKVMIAIVPTTVNSGLTVGSTPVPIPQSQRCTSFLPIYNVDIVFNNQSGILSNCPAELLYHKSIENGLRWIDWTNSGMSGHYPRINSKRYGIPLGSPLLLEFGTDIHWADTSLAPGVATNGTIQYKLSFYNYLDKGVKAKVVIIYFYEGVFTLSSYGQGSFQESVLSRTDVINANKDDVISTNELRQEMQFSGGSSFWSGLKKLGKKSMKIIKSKPFRKAISMIGELDVPVVSSLSRIADKELGSGGRLLNSNANGGRLMSQNDRGSAMVAGSKQMTASQLRNRLMK